MLPVRSRAVAALSRSSSVRVEADGFNVRSSSSMLLVWPKSSRTMPAPESGGSELRFIAILLVVPVKPSVIR